LPIQSVKEVCLYTPDLAKTQAFYCDVLGFDVISKVAGRHVFFRLGEQVLLCFNPEVTKLEKKLPPHYARGVQHIAFEVPQEEYEDWKEKIKNRGIEIVHEQQWNAHRFSFYFYDPSGHLLEIVPPGIWE
jgi:catechol 2,3-dioxygenase-like lactoylglutathione lyase family enzyme